MGHKKYPAEQFAQAIELILNRSRSVRCIVTGVKEDKDDINKILSYFSHLPALAHRLIDTSNYLPLNEFVTLVAKASFVIANDSSPVHIASGSNTPVIAIFGPTSWTFGFYPTSDKSITLFYKDENGNTLPCHPCSPHGTKECPEKHFRCMRDLSPHLLIQSAVKLVPDLFE